MSISDEQVNTIFEYLGETKAGIGAIKERLDRDATERKERQDVLDETLTLIRENHTDLSDRVMKLEATEQRNRGFIKGMSFIITLLLGAIAWLIDLFMKVKGN